MHMPGKDFRKRTRHCPRKGMVINMDYVLQTNALTKHRSEERRVGKEC